MRTVFITKYALTVGIIEVKEIRDSKSKDMVVYRYKDATFDQYAHGKDFWLTKEEAIERAEEMRIAKLKSLDKQIKKISALKF